MMFFPALFELSSINSFATVFLAAVTPGSALVPLPPQFYLRSEPQSSAQGNTSLLLVFYCV